MRSRVFNGVVVFAALALANCQCGEMAVCRTSADCTTGEVCVAQVCRTSSDAGDAGSVSDGGADAGTDAGLGTDAGFGKCGDGIVNLNEVCDDGNSVAGDGCSGKCAVEPGFACPMPGMPCVSTAVCGDGRLGGPETCDDQNTTSNDGCSKTCTLEKGWACPTVGIACVAARCGDGFIAGLEECDDSNSASNDGCSSTCVIEDGWACDGGCVKTVCGNGTIEGTEQCDDKNHNLGDGCDVFCHAEPKCTNGTCVAVCGDGVHATSEACDDGNTRAGDGCSATCTIEPGFTCTDSLPASQPSIPIPVVYRDFIPFDSNPAGHIDFNNENGGETGIVTDTLSADGKPVYASSGTTSTTHGATAFNQWYRDTAGINRTEVDRLLVTRNPGDGSYVFDSQNFFPLDGRGWQTDGTEPSRNASDGKKHNFSFTSELRYWFNFAGGESLAFRGDDDVWVFVNRHLAVDLGGVHSALDGTVTLNAGTAASLGLVVGGVYEVVVFQAERHVDASSYKLTLRGFNAPKSVCKSTCGDHIVTRFEVCDDGVNDGRYGGCLPGCLGRGPYCGDKRVDADAGEVCDDGVNIGGSGSCAPGCKSIRRCGDGLLNPADGEQCDDGNTTSGDGCDSTCHVEIN